MPKFYKPIIIGTWATIDLIKKSFSKGEFENSKYNFFYYNINVIYSWCKYYYIC